MKVIEYVEREYKPEESKIICFLPYSENNLKMIKKTIPEDDIYIKEYPDESEEEIKKPTQLDKIEAQVAYTAMLTDSLLEV